MVEGYGSSIRVSRPVLRSTPTVGPRILRVDATHPEPAAIAEAAGVLRAGGLVAFPTETVYGLGGRALDPAALLRIFAAKGRPSTHPIIAHVEDEAGARALAARWSDTASRLARAFWPGPLTLVVPRATHVHAAIGGGTDSIGIRAPAHGVARALLTALGEPIAAPSANRYQALSPTRAEHVIVSLGDAVDLVLDGGSCEHGLESTVLDVRGDVPLVLRPGSIDLAALQAIEPRAAYAEASTLPSDEARPSPGMDARHYAPRAPLRLASSRAAAFTEADERAAQGQTVGLVLRGPAADPPGRQGVLIRVQPEDPAGYARALYATLHDLDALSVDSIVVEAVPAGGPWRAAADRLARAKQS
jgi:L-threonylcarbamoyladenylate synthase